VAASLALALLIVACALAARNDGRSAYSTQVQLGSSEMPAAAESNAAGQTSYVYFTPSFELRGGQNVEISVRMPLANSWAYAVVDLVHEESGELASFEAELSHYSGVEDGEAWSEGSPAADHISRAQRSGKHVLRLEVQTPAASRSQVSLSVTQGVFDWGPLLLALVLIGLPATLLALYRSAFESQRWANSDLAPAPAARETMIRKTMIRRTMPEPAFEPGELPQPPGGKPSGLVLAYGAVGALTVLLYLGSGLFGWSWASEERAALPAGVRQAPGGYRTFHFWHSGYQGGK
jgi:hypothetical protein